MRRRGSALREAACAARRSVAVGTPVALFAVLITACGFGLPRELPAPDNLVATAGERAIALSWSAVPGADAYHVYRSSGEDGPFYEQGPFGPIPYAIASGPSYVDEPLHPVPYWYRVSAIARYSGAESPLSEAATATAQPTPPEWQDPATVTTLAAGGFTTVRLSLDRSVAYGPVHLLTVADGGSRVAVRRLDLDGRLAAVGSAFGSVDGEFPRVADLAAVSGSVYVAMVESSDRSVSVWRSDGATFTAHAAGLAQAHATSPLVSLAAAGEALFLAYRDAAGVMVTYRLEAGVPEAIPTPAVGGTLSLLEIAAGGGAVALAWKEYGGTGAAAYLSEWEVDGWSAPVTVRAPSSDPEEDITGLHIAIDAENGGVFVAYKVASGPVTLTDAVGDRVAGSSDGSFGGLVQAETKPVALAVDSELLHLLYGDQLEESAMIRSYDPEPPGEWSAAGPESLTASADLIALQLEAGGGRLFAAMARGRTVTVRAYQ